MTQTDTKARQALLFVLAYALWFASAALSLWAVLWLRILLLIDLPMSMSGINPWSLSAIDKFGTVLLGALWLIFVIVSERYFRRLPENELSLIDVVKVFAIEGVVLAVIYMARFLL